MKKVCPSDEQKAIAMPNSRNRHSTRMKSKVDAGRVAAGVATSERGVDMAAISPRNPHPGKPDRLKAPAFFRIAEAQCQDLKRNPPIHN